MTRTKPDNQTDDHTWKLLETVYHLKAPIITCKHRYHSLVYGPNFLLLEEVRQAERADDEQSQYTQRERSHLLNFHRRLALILNHHHRTGATMAESEGRTKLFQCIHCALVLGDGVAPFRQPIAFSCVTLSCTSRSSTKRNIDIISCDR